MNRPMNRNSSIVRIAPLSLAALLLVAGCGGHEDDHPHGPDGDHLHDGAEHAGAGHADAHDHGEGTHAHAAPETEAIYAEDAEDAEDADHSDVSDSEAHTHDDGSRHEH